ncbi:acyl carrier protein [Bradyrhizobium sp. USDA 326]
MISGLLTALAAGSSVICTDGFDSSSFFGWMRELQPTWYTAVPTIHRALLTAAEANPDHARPSSLRVIRSASASLAPAILRGLEATFGVPVLETYGMTEAASQIAANPFELRKVGSVGRAAGPEIAIMDETGRTLASGARGEIMLRGPNMSRGYCNDEAATQAAFRHGWFRTGDLGYLDADGYLFIVGRIKDVINRGGQKISPLEVEEVLLGHPAVLEAGVFAIPHQKLGENVAAVVVLRPNSEATSEQLRQFARKRLAAYKVPSLIRSVAALPKGAGGKVQRNVLAGHIAAVDGRDETRLPRNALETQLAEIWEGLLELPQVGVDQDVFALGADSLAVTQMRSRLRERFNVDFSFEDIFDCTTVAALAARIDTAASRRETALPAWHRLRAQMHRCRSSSSGCTCSRGSTRPATITMSSKWRFSAARSTSPRFLRASLRFVRAMRRCARSSSNVWASRCSLCSHRRRSSSASSSSPALRTSGSRRSGARRSSSHNIRSTCPTSRR